MIDQEGFENFVKQVAALPPHVKKLIRDTISKQYGVNLEPKQAPVQANTGITATPTEPVKASPTAVELANQE